MDAVSQALLEAQNKAEALFAAIVESGLIQPGKLESELTADIHKLASERFGVRRHWHKRIARAGSNTLLGYHDETRDRRIEADDVVYLDLGPVFDSWEADFGRTYALGSDPHKHRLVHDIGAAFREGKAFYENNAQLTTGELYDYVVALAERYGWEFGAPTRPRRCCRSHFRSATAISNRCASRTRAAIPVTGSWRFTSSIARGRLVASSRNC
jgi:Xaa-Pro dipeptidase